VTLEHPEAALLPTPPALRRRFGVTHWLRLAISLALILWIVRAVEWRDLARTVRATDPVYLALSLVADQVLVLISAWKWQILLRARSQHASLATCYRLYLIGFFFSTFLPTNVGGDVVRAYSMGRRTGRATDALASVFVERFTGITALVVFALIGIPFSGHGLYAAPVSWAVGAVVAAYLLLLWAVLDRRLLRVTRRRTDLPLVGKIVQFQEALHAYRGPRAVLARCLALSLLFYSISALNLYFSARAFHAGLGIRDALLVTPVVLIIVLLPISIGGLGLMELSYVLILGRLGISPGAALSTALLIRMKGILLSVSGGLGNVLPDWTSSRPEPGTSAPSGERSRP
jgi:uncharacterized protein (TIRG00374 family)